MTTVQLTLVKLLLGMMLACILPFSTWGSEANTQLTLSDAITAALEKNPEIQLWRQRVQVASARAKQAPYLEDPEIAFLLMASSIIKPHEL